MTYLRVVRHGQKRTRLLLADGNTVLVNNSELDQWVQGTEPVIPVLSAQKFGMEFEFYLPSDRREELKRKLIERLGSHHFVDANCYRTHDYTKWQWGTDSSIHCPSGFCGIEMKTPILRVGCTGDMSLLKDVLTIVNSCGGKVNMSTGMHVHLSTFGTTFDHEVVEKLFDCYGDWEHHFFDRIVSPSRRGNRYCDTCKSKRYSDRYRKLNIHAIYAYRYRKLNIPAIYAYGTIEFRQHQGTLSYEKASNWLKTITTWVTQVTKKSFKTPTSFESALSILEPDVELEAWLRSRYEDFND